MPKIKNFSRYKIPIIIFGSSILLGLFAIYNKIANKIVRHAKKYIGQQANPTKTKMLDANLDKKMADAGWQRSEWCCAFVRMVLVECSHGKAKNFFRDTKNISDSTQYTFAQLCKENKFCKRVDKTQKGDLVFYQRTDKPSNGHVEIISKVYKDGSYEVISGNDGKNSSVVKKKRPQGGGFNNKKILGYIRIKRLM